jgi:hypothetical protein
MSVTGNLPFNNINTNSTTAYFNNFFKPNFTVSQNVDDAIVGYFQTMTGNKESGAALAASVIYTAQTQDIDPILLLDEFRKLNKNELNAYLTMFLNLNRVSTSLLGLSNSPQLNKYIARSILA